MKFSLSHITLPAFGAALLLTMTSCGDIRQDLKINADGSGVLETSFDLGDMMSMMKGMGELNMDDVTISPDAIEEDKNLSAPETPQETKDPMEALMDKITNPEYNRDFDTLISFVSIMPDSVREKETRMDLVDKLKLRLQSPAKSADLTVGIVMHFKSQAELKEMIDYIGNMSNDPTGSLLSNAGPGGLQKETFIGFEMDMKAGWIRIDSVDYSGAAGGMGMPGDSLMTSEDMGMVEMMFGNTKIKSTIHVPGEVTSCTNPDAILTKDNRVIIEHSFMDIMKGGNLPGYTIYFTPNK